MKYENKHIGCLGWLATTQRLHVKCSMNIWWNSMAEEMHTTGKLFLKKNVLDTKLLTAPPNPGEGMVLPLGKNSVCEREHKNTGILCTSGAREILHEPQDTFRFTCGAQKSNEVRRSLPAVLLVFKGRSGILLRQGSFPLGGPKTHFLGHFWDLFPHKVAFFLDKFAPPPSRGTTWPLGYPLPADPHSLPWGQSLNNPCSRFNLISKMNLIFFTFNKFNN